MSEYKRPRLEKLDEPSEIRKAESQFTEHYKDETVDRRTTQGKEIDEARILMEFLYDGTHDIRSRFTKKDMPPKLFALIENRQRTGMLKSVISDITSHSEIISQIQNILRESVNQTSTNSKAQASTLESLGPEVLKLLNNRSDFEFEKRQYFIQEITDPTSIDPFTVEALRVVTYADASSKNIVDIFELPITSELQQIKTRDVSRFASLSEEIQEDQITFIDLANKHLEKPIDTETWSQIIEALSYGFSIIMPDLQENQFGQVTPLPDNRNGYTVSIHTEDGQIQHQVDLDFDTENWKFPRSTEL